MVSELKPGHAFHRWTSTEPTHHFHVIIKRLLNGTYITVNFSSVREGRKYDDTCVMGPEDEPWLNRAYVRYRDCCQVTAANLKPWTQGEIRTLQPHNLNRIIQGALSSDQTPEWAKKRLREA